MNRPADRKDIYFISDLHLSPKHTDSCLLFQQFVEQYGPSAKAIYVLGDLFDYWLGDDDNSELNQYVSKTFRKLATDGCRLYFLPGNRDFLVGKRFLTQCKMALLPDPCTINFYGKQYVLSHGDLLCRRDKAHLIFRKLTQNPLSKKLFLARSLSKRRTTAEKARRLSRGNKKINHDPVSNSYCQKLLAKSHSKLLIHGHTHQAAVHTANAQQPFHRIVLGDWHSTAEFAVINEHGNLRLQNIKLNAQ